MMVCCPKCQYWFDDFTGVCPKCKNNIFGEDAFNVPPPPPELIADGSSLPRTGGTMQSGTPDTAQDRSGETVPPPPPELMAGGGNGSNKYGRHGSVAPPPPQMRAGYEHIAPKQDIPPDTDDINSPNYVPGYINTGSGIPGEGIQNTGVPQPAASAGGSQAIQNQPQLSAPQQTSSGSSKTIVIAAVIIIAVLLVIIAVIVFVLVPGLFQRALSALTESSAASSQTAVSDIPVNGLLFASM